MISFRNCARSVSRSLTRLTTSPSRLPIPIIQQTSILRPPIRAVSVLRNAAFSTTRATRESAGDVDQELSAKCESELEMEKGMRDSDELPANVKYYLQEGPFEIHDTPGQEEVVLTRSFGNEKIRITFSIADLNTLDPEADRYDDKALEDEYTADAIPEETQSGGANTKGSVNQGRTKGGNIAVAPEDSIAPGDRPELADESATSNDPDDQSFPARVNVTIEKEGHGALQIETVAQDGMIQIENVYFFPQADLADAQSAEKDWIRRGMYTGPPFGNLDIDLQVLLERYLDERGVDTRLALWVPEYIDFKEQREYLAWLANVKSFVDT